MAKAPVIELVTERQMVCLDVIETLEEVLAHAKDGEISAVAIAFIRPDGSCNTQRSATDDMGRLLGAITLLQARATRECDQ